MRQNSLTKISRQIVKCRKCRLWKTRKRAVPGEGSPHARIMLVGQAPGKTEDATGRPFVGRAGKLLTELLESAGIRRKDVFITSVIKCFPPGNRAPKKDEIAACKPHLEKQIALIKPKIIVLLGNIAIKTVLGDVGKLDKIHGKPIRKESVICIPNYHPAAAMRFPKIKRKMMVDFKILSSRLSKTL
ncbi:MAG: uracil-DNA glycosylase [Candidatus Bilamarchaeaceae archaeon]